MKHAKSKLFIYSHTHWDREWYLSQNQFQYRLIRTIDEIVEMLAADNGFNTFVLDGQTSILEDYLALRPERRDTLRQLVSDGKLVIGPWFTMPDIFLPDGEALIRNLLRGARDCAAFGAPFPNTGYVPDSFGHIEQMPQLMRGVGIDNYIFSRGRPEDISPAKGWKREFIWEAPDGSRVFALPLSTSYVAGMFLPGPGEPEVLRQRLQTALQAEQNSHRQDIALLPHGVDHTWLQRDIPDILKAIPALLPDVEVRHGSLQAAIDEWKKDVPGDLRVHRGQLRGRLGIAELHGTLSSRIDNKLMNELAQMHIENLAEPLQAIAGMFGRQGSPWFFEKAWRLLFHNHAHDSICGCSQDRVHTDVNTRFREVIELGIDLADSALDYLNSPARREAVPTLIVYAGLNGGTPLVDFVIKLAEKPDDACCFEDDRGARYALQWTQLIPLRVNTVSASSNTGHCQCARADYWECRGCVYIPDLQPGEVRKLVFRRGRAAVPENAVRVTKGRELGNGLLQVRVNANGTLDLTDVVTGVSMPATHFFAQEGDCGGGYHFEPIPGDQRRDTLARKAKVAILENGPLRSRIAVATALRVPAGYDRKSGKRTGQCTMPIRTVFTLEAGSRLLKCHTRVDNRAKNQRIRLVLPTGLDTQTVHADASFAVHENDAARWPADPGQSFHPMRNFVSLHQADKGLAFLGKGLHEYEIVPGSAGTSLEITLLRSVDFVMQCCTWETPEAQLIQPLDYDYALILQGRDWRAAGIPSLAAAFRNPPIAQMHGDFAFPTERDAHATIGFYVKAGKVEIPVDSNRSSWKRYNAERDGWRRVEPDRFVRGEIPSRIVPFTVDGRKIVISAFKDSEDGNGQVLRFWSYAASPQTVTVAAYESTAYLTRCNLLEQPLAEILPSTATMEISVKPFEIVTLRFTPNGKNKH
jgi:alpha-mannosidase